MSIFLFAVFLNRYKIGKIIDSNKSIKVYYYDKTTNTNDKFIVLDGYLLGYKYQCVEFVKHFYFEVYKYKMLDFYENLKNLFKNAIGVK